MLVIGLTVSPKEGLDLRLLRNTIIQPSQTRVIPVEILQLQRFRGGVLEFTIHAISTSGDVELPVSLPIVHLPHWSTDASRTFYVKSTHLYSGFTPTAFLVKPPLEHHSTPQVPVAALRRISSLLTCTSPLIFWYQTVLEWIYLIYPSGGMLYRDKFAAGRSSRRAGHLGFV